MDRLERLHRESIEDMRRIGIPISDCIRVTKLNTRLRSVWGRCIRRGGIHYIEVSKMLLECEDIHVKSTICHELIHTVEGCMNHGENFKKYANIANRELGLNIRRCVSSEEKGYSPKEVAEGVKQSNIEYKYSATCSICGRQHKYKKMGKVLKEIRDGVAGYNIYSCSNCKSEQLKFEIL